MRSVRQLGIVQLTIFGHQLIGLPNAKSNADKTWLKRVQVTGILEQSYPFQQRISQSPLLFHGTYCYMDCPERHAT